MPEATKPFDFAKNLEFPAAFREFAEKGAAQTKEWFERMKAIAEEGTDLLEKSFTTGANGAAQYNCKLIDYARSNANAAFDHAIALLGAKSASEAIEIATTRTRNQFDSLADQAKELSALAQKLTTQAAEPVQAGISKVLKKVA